MSRTAAAVQSIGARLSSALLWIAVTAVVLPGALWRTTLLTVPSAVVVGAGVVAMIVGVLVEVRALKHGVHSGLYGGAVPDGLTALCRLLATLHDDAGDVAVPGLITSEAAELDYSEDDLRAIWDESDKGPHVSALIKARRAELAEVIA